MLSFSCALLSSSSGLGLFRVKCLAKKNLIRLAPLLVFPSFSPSLAFSSRSSSSVPRESILAFTETASDSTMAAYDWCCTASVNAQTDTIDIQKIAGYDNDATHQAAIKTLDDGTFDLTSNSQWMEWIESMEDRVHVEGGAGAYDVMRCDLTYPFSKEDHHPSMKPIWRVWGQDFHLTRLTSSYRSLLQHMDNASTSDEEVERALAESREIIRDLLQEAESANIMKSRAPPHESKVNDVTIQLTKLTVLWTPHAKDGDTEGNQEIVVRGHACSSCKPVQIHKRPSSIVATMALPLTGTVETTTSDKQAQNAEVLPSRFRSPQNKVASWCRLRKPLEDPDTYKPPGVGEVLMVRPTPNGQQEILEGLTSNVCAIYKDGTVRTADKGVLFGYVRHLVVDCAERAGLRMDYSPILLKDKEQWESAFITSSSRLIYPISRILIPEVTLTTEDGDDDGSHKSVVTFQEFWCDPNLVGDKKQGNGSSPRWLDLLNEVLIEGGYEPTEEEE